VSGPKSCLIALGIGSLLGFGSIVAAKFFIERRNADVLAAAQELGGLLERGSKAPGASELAAIGCEEAVVLTPAELRAIAQPLADTRAQSRTGPPKGVSLEVPRDTVVICATRSDAPPTCATIASAYAAAAKPADPFITTAQNPGGTQCSERYDGAAAPMGSVPSPNVPLLVQPAR
jgi:hypothetical protein